MWSENFKNTTVVASAILCAALLAPIPAALAESHFGTVGRNDGTAARNDGAAARNDGTAGRNDGTAGRNDGAAGRNDGTAARNDGAAGRNDGTAGRNDGTAGRNDGAATRNDGSGGRKPASAKPSSSALTLEHLRNGTYQIPDLACSYTTVPLTDGKGEEGGVRVVFGRAVFGSLTADKRPTAVVHLAYFTPEFGWLQELAFVRQQGGKLVQSAEYTLDDREDLKEVSIVNGEVLLETIVHAEAPLQTTSGKLTKISLADTKQGCLLQASEWHRDPQSGRLTAQRSLAPYLSRVEDRIGRCWSPTNKDRGEHVVIAFTIQPSGQVADIHISNSSEVESADRAAMEAVVEAGPFPPLPDSSDKSLTVCLEFQAGVSVKQ